MRDRTGTCGTPCCGPAAPQAARTTRETRQPVVANEERRKDLFKWLDETVQLEVLAQDELDQALARQRNNTTPNPMEVLELSLGDSAFLDDTEACPRLAGFSFGRLHSRQVVLLF